MDTRNKTVFKSIAKFSPITQEEIEKMVPKYQPYQVEDAIKELRKEGYIQTDEAGKLKIETDDFMLPKDGQRTLTGKDASREESLNSKLPDGITTTEKLTIELTPEQARLFEKMRADVSHECGYMDTEEFVSWVLREARRMTEV